MWVCIQVKSEADFLQLFIWNVHITERNLAPNFTFSLTNLEFDLLMMSHAGTVHMKWGWQVCLTRDCMDFLYAATTRSLYNVPFSFSHHAVLHNDTNNYFPFCNSPSNTFPSTLSELLLQLCMLPQPSDRTSKNKQNLNNCHYAHRLLVLNYQLRIVCWAKDVNPCDNFN